jgi:hypothetical protein
MIDGICAAESRSTPNAFKQERDHMDRIEDRLAIDELRNRWALYIDTDQLELVVDLFAEDAVFDARPLGRECVEGAAALRTHFSRGLNTMKEHIHYVTTGITEFHGEDEASGRCNVLFMGVNASDYHVQATVFYEDVYVRRGGRWLIKSRVVNRYRNDQVATGRWEPRTRASV